MSNSAATCTTDKQSSFARRRERALEQLRHASGCKRLLFRDWIAGFCKAKGRGGTCKAVVSVLAALSVQLLASMASAATTNCDLIANGLIGVEIRVDTDAAAPRCFTRAADFSFTGSVFAPTLPGFFQMHFVSGIPFGPRLPPVTSLAATTPGNGVASTSSNVVFQRSDGATALDQTNAQGILPTEGTYTYTSVHVLDGVVYTLTANVTTADAFTPPGTVTINSATVTYEPVRQRTSRIISNFMTRRGDAILSNQPDYNERLNQGGSGAGNAGVSFSGEGSYSNNRMNFSTSLRQMLAANNAQKGAQVSELGEMMKLGLQSGGTQSLGQGLGLRSNLATSDGAPGGFDLWVRGRWARYDDDTSEGDLGLLFIGADYKFNDGLVLGLTAQLDWTDETDDTEGYSIKGRGWMIGPYLVARLHQNLILDASFSWGKSDNEVSPYNTYTDDFDGQRLLASAKLTGSLKFGAVHVAPHVGLMYFRERQKAYIDSQSIDIPGQTVKIGRLTFGPRFSTTIHRKDGTAVMPYLGVKGLWDFQRTDVVNLTTGLASESTDDLRARVDAGVSVRLPDGLTLNGEGFYDGIGANDYKSYGGSVRLSIPLQRAADPSQSMKLGAGSGQTVGFGAASSTDRSSRIHSVDD